MIILICSQKGGVGKTTLATNAAAVFANRGESVLIIDADKQASATNWHSIRSKTPYPKIDLIQLSGDLSEQIPRNYDKAIIDVAGLDSIELRSALSIADVVIIPTRPFQFELSTMRRIGVIVHEEQQINPNLKAFCVITIAPTNSRTFTLEAVEFLQTLPNIALCKTIIGERMLFMTSNASGLGVNELTAKTNSDHRAQAEFLDFIGEFA
jgi:chromosome partitioning protein